MTQIPMISAASWVIEPPDLWQGRLAAAWADKAPRLVATSDGVAWKVGDKTGGTPAFVRSLSGGNKQMGVDEIAWLATVEGRRWLQRRDEVDGEVLYGISDVWALINDTGDADFIRACYRAYNDWLGEFCAQDPERFIGVAKIPTTGIIDAVSELRRAREELGLRGAMLDGWPCGKGTDEPPAKASMPFWEAAASLGVPVSFYRSLSVEDVEAEPTVTGGYAPEIWSDLSAIIYANVCDALPDIKFVVVGTSPGWAPALFEGMNESYMRTAGKRQVELGDPDLMPADYARKFVWYTVQEDRFTVLNRSYFGAAHLMWGSFACSQDALWPNNRQEFARITSGLPVDDQRCLANDVVSRIYGLAGAPRFTAHEAEAFERYALL